MRKVRRSLIAGALAVAVFCAAVGAAIVVSADHPNQGVRSDTSQPVLGGPKTAPVVGDDGLPPEELEDGRLHATVDNRILPEPARDGAVIDHLGRRADGRCRASAKSYGVARLNGGGHKQEASITLDHHTCDMVIHIHAEN